MRTIKVAMLGIGTVAKGAYRSLEMNRHKIQKSSNADIQIVKILNRHPERDRGIDIPREKYVTDVEEIINDPEIDIVIELIGGIQPASDYMKRALLAGKNVVTANKAAVVAHGRELQKIAMEKKVMFRFEASVAGGIPILDSISRVLIPNEFSKMVGILNGTTNYILTQMEENGMSYEGALSNAQAKGFAEADPTADVEGIDVGNKLSILVSMIFGMDVPLKSIPIKGITKVSAEDIEFAKENGYRIKLLAIAENKDGKLYCDISPTLIPASHPLANVNNEFNAVLLTGNAVDDIMFYGKGAGELPTGSAIIGDVISIAKAINKNAAYDTVPRLHFDGELEYVGEGEAKYYIRVMASDRPGILGEIASTFGKYDIGIETMVQRSRTTGSHQSVPIIFIVYKTQKKKLDQALDEIITKQFVESEESVMRVLD